MIQGLQSALSPAAAQAGRIVQLFWIMLGVCTVVYLLVIGFLIYGLFRRRRGIGHEPRAEAKARQIITAATVGTAGVLLFFLVISVLTGRAVSAYSPRNALVIEVTGHQWWWEVRYPNSDASRQITTANEIHV